MDKSELIKMAYFFLKAPNYIKTDGDLDKVVLSLLLQNQANNPKVIGSYYIGPISLLWPSKTRRTVAVAV